MMNIIYAVAVLGVLGALWGAILAFASKVFAVEVDPREEAVLGCLIALMQYVLAKSAAKAEAKKEQEVNE